VTGPEDAGRMSEADEALQRILERLAVRLDDEDAWRMLYTRLRPWVYATCFRQMRGHASSADEAAQEVFVRLATYSHFLELTDPRAFRKYLGMVCHNVVRTMARAQALRDSRHADVSTSGSDAETALATRLPLPDQLLEVRELEDAILERLEPRDQELFRLMRDGYSLSEIAEKSGLKYSYAGVRLHRIRLALRRFLDARRRQDANP
jgi:RNA polymerase sigma factor (sigma-70 family)